MHGSVVLAALDVLDMLNALNALNALDTLDTLDMLVVRRRGVQRRVLVHDWRGAGAGAQLGQRDLCAGARWPILNRRAALHDAAAKVAVDRLHRHLPRVTGAGGRGRDDSIHFCTGFEQYHGGNASSHSNLAAAPCALNIKRPGERFPPGRRAAIAAVGLEPTTRGL